MPKFRVYCEDSTTQLFVTDIEANSYKEAEYLAGILLYDDRWELTGPYDHLRKIRYSLTKKIETTVQ